MRTGETRRGNGPSFHGLPDGRRRAEPRGRGTGDPAEARAWATLKSVVQSSEPYRVGRVLVIDDSAGARQLICKTLQDGGYEVVEAVDGVDGLEKLRSMTDLVLALCDVNMPRMTGVEMVVEAHTQNLDTPIIMLTTEVQPSMIRRAREAGAKGWIVKPFKPELLLSAVNKVVAARSA